MYKVTVTCNTWHYGVVVKTFTDIAASMEWIKVLIDNHAEFTVRSEHVQGN